MHHPMATTNKTRAWRPTEEFYQRIRERFTEGISDTLMLNMIAEEWLLHQSASPNDEEVLHSETLEDIKAGIEAILNRLDE